MKKRGIFRLLPALLLVLALFALSGCAGKEAAAAPAAAENNEAQKKSGNRTAKAEDYTEGVVQGSSLYQKNGVIFWGYDDRLCSALIGEDGLPYDFISEGSMGEEIYSVAVYDGALYLATDIGIIRLATDQAEAEQGYGVVLGNDRLSIESFQIYEDYIYYTYGYNLRRVPINPGEREKLEENITCMQVSSKGIYCLNKDGELLLVSLDGTERKTLCKLDSQGDLGIFDNKAYITTGEADDYIYVYDLERDELEELELEEDISPYNPVWVLEGKLYYNNEKFKLRCLDLSTGEDELLPTEFDLPDYNEGFMLEGFGYYKLSDSLYWAELGEDYSEKIKIGQALNSTASVSGAYDIARNIGVGYDKTEFLYSDCFVLNMPDFPSDWDYEVLSKTAVQIVHYPSRDAGYGGNVVSIMAYDKDDDSYEILPHYTVAGESKDKVYIACFPTDVQYSRETEKGWRQLSEFMQQIDEDDPDNPFSCAWDP